jgi:hypothetical protein
MPNLYRTLDGKTRKPGTPLALQFADGSVVETVWAGSATEEKLAWWLRDSGGQLAQSEAVAAVAVKADDNGEIIWGDAPDDARLLFVLMAPPPGKHYRLAKMLTTAANPAQIAYFRHTRFCLFGTLMSNGIIQKTPPLPPPPRDPSKQGELF